MLVKFLVFNDDRSGKRYSDEFVEDAKCLPEIGTIYKRGGATY